MTDNDHKTNVPCRFGETLVAVLYNEASQNEKSEFSAHVNECNVCREELMTFGEIKNTVAFWREADFSGLQSPEITIPQRLENFAPVTQSVSWFDKLRGFFAPTAFGWQTAAAFSLLAIFAAFVFVFISWSGKLSNNVVEVVPPAQATPPEKDVMPVVSPAPRAAPEVAEIQEQKRVNDSIKKNKPVVKTVVKASAAPAPRLRTTERRRAPNQNQTAKDLEEFSDEFEDDSLRLVDLLEEVESSE